MGAVVNLEGPVRCNVSVNKTWWHKKCFSSECFDYINPQSSEYGMIWWNYVIPVSSVHRHTAATHKIQEAAAARFVKQRALCTHDTPVRLSFHSAKYVTSGRLQQVSWYLNPLAMKLDLHSLAHHLCKMWIFYKPRRVTLGNTRHFVEQ